GVRNLQRELEGLLRDFAMSIAEGDDPNKRELDLSDVLRVLGPPKYHEDIVDKEPPIGVVTGLGWTPTGGKLLFVEARSTPGDGQLRFTGRLGDIMRESGQTALSLIRSRSRDFGLEPDFLNKRDIHVHLPAGAIPKDGPSAGITVTTAVLSNLLGRPVRTDLAMTGEITLRGHVLPIGGVREKVLAAHRAGIRHVVLPHRNAKDEPDIPPAVLRELSVHYVRHIDEVIELALLDPVELEAAQ